MSHGKEAGWNRSRAGKDDAGKQNDLAKLRLTQDCGDSGRLMDDLLRVGDNFDVIRKDLQIGQDRMTLYYIDGFVKDAVMEKLMIFFLGLKELVPRSTENLSSGDGDGQTVRAPGGKDPDLPAQRFVDAALPYVETDVTQSVESMVRMVLAGATLILGTGFGAYGVIVDARTYPARETGEPEGDKVMRGARDGFVETLVFNTALIRRRIRDPHLTMSYLQVGNSSGTDVVVCYMSDRADKAYVDKLKKRLQAINTDSLSMGHESLAESLIKTHWYNPFPKIRYTERPDAAAAQLLEGSVLILCDNSPEAMILPTSIFDFMQETNDFYFPPLTGTYIRVLRQIIFWLTLFLTPVWYLLLRNPAYIPAWLDFILPTETGRIPIIAQLFLVEFIIDGLRMASLNTPNMLSNSLSVVGGLILGDFAVSIGWLIPEVILYMAFVAIANFTQRSYELGYAFKFLRMGLLLLTALFNTVGFVIGCVLILVLIATNATVNGTRNYLYPLIPFNGRALKSLFFRVRKDRGAVQKGKTTGAGA